MHKCDTKYIVEANTLLKPNHRKIIQVTPLRWCLELGKVLEINCPLIREFFIGGFLMGTSFMFGSSWSAYQYMMFVST